MGFMILTDRDNADTPQPGSGYTTEGRQRLLLILKTLGHLIDKAAPIHDHTGKHTGYRVPVRELQRLRAMTAMDQGQQGQEGGAL